MDERTPPTLTTTVGSAAAPPSDQLSHQPVTAESDATVVYCGDAEGVRAGFLLALGLMQASSNLLLPDIAPPGGRHTPEDN